MSSADHAERSSDFELAALEHAANYRAALVEQFAPYLIGDVVEVGSGVGHISQQLSGLSSISSLTAVEPGAHLVRQFRERLPLVPLIEGTVEQLGGERDFDAIVSINVLEHIEHDEHELAAYARLLRARSGYLCLFVPARPEIYAPIDRDFGHHRRYAKAALGRKLETAGFALVRLDYFNAVGYFTWWLNFCVLRKRKFGVRSVKLFDRVIFPAVWTLESRLGAPPFGQSLIAVGRVLAREAARSRRGPD